MENNSSPIGTLFDKINYYGMDDLDNLSTSLSYEQSLYFLIEAVQSAYRRNAFTMVESEIISKSIRSLTKPVEPKKDSD